MANKPKKHRCPIRRVHKDGTTCTHKISPSGKPRDGENCPGAAGYDATCSCGHAIPLRGIRAIVEQDRRTHINEHERAAAQAAPLTHTVATGVGATRHLATGVVTMDLETPGGTVHVSLTEELAEALGLLLLNDPEHSDGTEHDEDLPVVTIDGQSLVCGACGARDQIVEYDMAIRENTLVVQSPTTISAGLGDSYFNADHYECKACDSEVEMPPQVELIHS